MHVYAISVMVPCFDSIAYNAETCSLSRFCTAMRACSPTDQLELRALLGTYNYYRKFLKNSARKAALLNRLLQTDVPWEWSASEISLPRDNVPKCTKHVLRYRVSMGSRYDRPGRVRS
jgi:hypothetical protein